ncbi:MAG: sulfite exporter TauE/SafE family protein [Betaproteobacteria bacterium]|nr:MAG: sulfite exporter TauE/SafE family protein [Betaproteobacteria bacterium]
MIDLSVPESGYCAVVLVASYALRGSTGFGGFAAMPLLALVIPMKVLVPVWTLLTISSSATLFGKDRRHVSMAMILRILPSCTLGILLGLWLFKTLDAAWLTRGLGALVSGYGFYALWQTRGGGPAKPPPRAIAPVASFLAGAVGTIFGTMASLFFAVYMDAIRVTKDQFRGTLAALMMTLAVIRGLGYFAVGEFGRESLLLFAAALPFMLLGIYLGDRVHSGMSEMTFRRVVCAILILSGVPLMIK